MAQCITCGSELHPERAEKYNYCMEVTLPRSHRRVNLQDRVVRQIQRSVTGSGEG